MTVLEELAHFTAGFHLDDEALEDKAVLCIADALECCLAGTNQDPRTLGAYRYVRGCSGSSTMFLRGERVRSEQAAFYNTVTGSVSSRNDISKPGSCHPGAIVVPVVLALAEEHPCTGRQLLEAVVCGYETMIRLGVALKRGNLSPSFRSTALVAPFGAAFAAAKLLNLTEEETISAASLACHSAGGVNNWALEGTGEDVFQNAWGARNGIEACRLAAAGVHASHTAVEGAKGLLSALGADGQAGWITDRLGEHFYMLEIEHKAMDACFKLQAPCQAAQKLVEQYAVSSREIQEVEIGLCHHAITHAGSGNTRITSLVQAIVSVPFGVASVLAAGSCQKIHWGPPVDPEVERLMSLCRLVEREEWTRGFPEQQGADVKVRLRDGRCLCQEQKNAEGMSPRELWLRLDYTASACMGEERAQQLIQLIHSLPELEDAARLAQALASSDQ